MQNETAGGFTALVLAGGSGSRLRPVLSDRPKVLAPVDGEPFLLLLLDQLAAAGCRRAVLCTGHMAERVERECGREHAGVELVYSRETEPLGTAGAISKALPLCDDDAVLVMNGDSYVDVELAEFVAWARAHGDCAALVTVTVDDASRYGTVACNAAGRVVGFAEKQAGAGAVNAGVYWLERRVVDALVRRLPASLERDVLPELADIGLRAWQTDAAFLDIGTPESYAAAPEFFAALARARRRDRRGLLVVDRDGTLIEERHYLGDPGGVSLLPGVVDGLRAFVAEGYELAIVTNQSGIGRGYFDADAAAAVNAEVVRQLEAGGVTVRGVYLCPHRPEEGCECRKPAPGLFRRAMRELGYGPGQCLVVGDKKCDVDLGARLGARTVLVRTGYGAATERDGMCAPDLVVDGLGQLAALEVGP